MTALAQAPPIVKPVPTGKLVRSWFILIPLLYYANSGFPGAADDYSAQAFSVVHEIGLLTVCLICSAFILKRMTTVFAASLKLRLIMAWPVLALVSCLWSDDPKQSLVSALTLFCFTFFIIYISETFTPLGQFDLIMITGAVAVPLSIFLALFVPKIGVTPSGWRGIFVHKQQCAAAVTMLLVTALHWKPNRPIQRPLRAIYVVLCFVLIGMSQSRTGWLLTLMALLVSATLWTLQKFAAKDAFFVLFTGIPTAAGLAYLVKLLASLILTSVGKDPTLSQRTVIWAAVWVEIKEKFWLGYGYESFWRGLAGASKDIVLVSGWNISQAQSGYLDLWLQFGVVGIFLLLLTVGQAMKNAIRIFRTTENPTFVRWAVVVIFCNLWYNIGETDFGTLRILFCLFMLACIGLQKQASIAAPAKLQPERPDTRLALRRLRDA